ncbi:hypothetical protein MJH12_14585, partial [bacterium]|nr:hypothetical protein [bacterium]
STNGGLINYTAGANFSMSDNVSTTSNGGVITIVSGADFIMATGSSINAQSSGNIGTINVTGANDVTSYILVADAAIDIKATNGSILNNSSISSDLGNINEVANVTLTQNSGADLVTSGAGSISLISNTDLMTLNAKVETKGSGNIDLTATFKNIVMSSDSSVISTSGNIQVRATQGSITSNNLSTNNDGEITINARDQIIVNNSLSAGGSGKIDLISSNASLIINSLVDAGSGFLTLQAQTNISLDRIVTSNDVSIIATSGAISDISVDEIANITANAATIVADKGVGTREADINTSLNRLKVRNQTSGDIFINESSGLIVEEMISNVENSSISLSLDGGALSIIGDFVSTGGDIVIANSGDIVLDKELNTQSGNIDISAGGSITQNVNIFTNDGDINFSAGSYIFMNSVSTLKANKSGNASITLNAKDDVSISKIDSDATINITSTQGKISDNLVSEDANLIATHLKVVAANGIGTSSEDLDTQVASLELSNTSSGGIYIDELDQVEIQSIAASNDVLIDAAGIVQSGNIVSTGGALRLVSSAGITMNSNTSTRADQSSIQYNASGEVIITQLDSSTDISIEGSKITQRADLTSSTGSILLKSASSILMSSGTKSSVNGKSISYIADGNIELSQLDTQSGHVDLKTNTASEILDVNNNHETNVTANSLNMMGHGAFGRGINIDDAGFTELKKKAIETNVSKVFIANSNTEDAIAEVLIGKETALTMIETNDYSLQLVNKGLFLNSKTILASDYSVETSGFDAVEEFKFTKQVDYQLLDFLAKNSDDLVNQVQALKLKAQSPSTPVEATGYLSSIAFRNTNSLQESEFDQSLNSMDQVLNLDSEIIEVDFLSLEDNNIIPGFGLNYIDDSILEDEEDESFMFEYWIEDIAI